MTEDAALPPAAAQLDEIRRAYRDASRPPLPRPTSALSAFCAGAGVVLVAQGRSGWEHLAFLLAGVAMFAVAHLVPRGVRRRRGLDGYRGWTRTENTTLLLCALVLVVCGLGADRELSWIFVGLGVVTVVAWYAMARGVLVAGAPHR